jgi:hypothetical protein
MSTQPGQSKDHDDDMARRRRAGVRRTAWIFAAIAAAFFIASLVHGHLDHITH